MWSARAFAQTGLSVYQPGIENQIWQQLSYVGVATCVTDPNTGACTTTPDTSLGTYYYPIQITTDVLSATSNRTTTCAADNGIINYVTDQWNNRVQAFDYCGNPVAFPNAPGGWPTIGGGPAGGVMSPGSGPTGLDQPEGIAVDAAHHIIVGDRNNARVALFNEDGSFYFEIAVPPGSQPTGVAVFPGTVMDPTGAGHGWLGVTLSASGMSKLQIYDSTGAFVAENPEPETTGGAIGGLGGPSDLTIDAAGRVYVADLFNSRINAYLVDTVAMTVAYQFTFGAPLDPANLQPADLQNPYSVAFDQQGRLIVGDTANQRLAVYTISFAAPATATTPTIAYQFYLDARGDLDGFPRGIAQDRQGRLYVVDTTNHRMQRFEMPTLAVVDVQTTPAGFVPSGSQFTITAALAVPATKVAVVNALPSLVTSGDVTYLSGPSPVSPTPAVPTPQINPGEIAYYSWTYASGTAGGNSSVTVGGSGDPNSLGAVAAPTKTISVSLGCSGCETTPPTTTAAISSAYTSGIYRSSPVNVTLDAVDGASVGTPSGVREIRVHLNGAETALGLPQCLTQFGGPIEYCISAPSGSTQPTLSATIQVVTEGSTTAYFRSVDNFGNVEALNSVTTVIDSTAPVVHFTPTVVPNPYGWYNTATPTVAVNYTVVDSESGLPSTQPPTGTLTFSQEGVTTQNVTVIDNVGNTAMPGYTVRIDLHAPTVNLVAAQTIELATSAGTAVTLSPTATDALSGVASVTTNAPSIFPLGTTTVRITATDYAGNVGTGTTTVTVHDTTPPQFTVVPAPVTLTTTALVGTAAMPNLVPAVTATDLEAVTVTQSIAPNAPLAPGLYTVTFTATDAAGNKSTATTSVTVLDLTPPTIAACAPAANVAIDPNTSLATVPNMTGGVQASDNSGGLLTITQAPVVGTTLGIGVYPVTFTVADPSRNVASCGSTLTVLAVQPPTATITLSPGVLWPPNHKLVRITATLTISDPNATVELVSITSSEPDNGLGDGDKPIDEQTVGRQPISTVYGTDTRQFLLRSERSGRGPGRVYTVTYRITNAAGSILVSGVVLVPHDMRTDDDATDGEGTHGQLDDGHYPGDGDRSCWANEYQELWQVAYRLRDEPSDDHERESKRPNGKRDR